MSKFAKAFTKKRIVLLCVNAFLLILVIVVCVISGKLKNTLVSQEFADRWSSNGEQYGQVSVFLSDSVGLTAEGLYSAVTSFDQKLEEVSLAPASENEDALLWTYGYSSESILSVTRESATAEAGATGVGENFFLFHPLQLLSGSYIFGSDLMSDRVVIDQNLAWQLFGATDVAGMEIEIGGLPYIIAGVVRSEDDFASTAAYGARPRLYLPYEALLLTDNDAKITCLEILMPNPVSNFSLQTTKSVFEGLSVTETNRTIVDNTARYSLTNLFGVMGDFGLRSMRQVGFAYPYWENAARMVEDYLALFLIITIILLIIPAISLVRLIIWLWRREKMWHIRDLKILMENKIVAGRERKS